LGKPGFSRRHEVASVLLLVTLLLAAAEGISLNYAIEKMSFAEDHGTRIFDQILASGGLAHIAENIFDQLDGKTLANCEEVSPIWRQFIANNIKLWKMRYLDKLAKPGSDAHRLIKSNPKLFQFDLQADQGKFQIFADISGRYH
jgi:hypothetical protein